MKKKKRSNPECKKIIVVPDNIVKLMNKAGMTEKEMWPKIKILCLGYLRAVAYNRRHGLTC